MTSEFGSGHTLLNAGIGTYTDDDAGSASESASLASWGRNLLIQAPYAKIKLVYPADTISTKAFSSHQNLNRSSYQCEADMMILFQFSSITVHNQE